VLTTSTHRTFQQVFLRQLKCCRVAKFGVIPFQDGFRSGFESRQLYQEQAGPKGRARFVSYTGALRSGVRCVDELECGRLSFAEEVADF